MDWRKIVKIILGVLLILLVIWGGYYLWQAFTASPAPPPLSQPPGNLVPDIPEPAKLNALTENAVFDYWASSKTGAIYYLNPLGQVVKKVGGAEEIVNSQTLNQLNSVQAAPDGTFAIAKWNYPYFTTFSVFNAVTNAWQPLPENTIAAAWSPNSQQIAYVETGANAGELKILNVVSQKTQKIANLNQKDLILQWVLPSEIFFITAPPTINLPSSLWTIRLNNQTLWPLIRDNNGLVVNWSKDGSWGLKLNDSGNNLQLAIIDGLGNVIRRFSFTTLPEKCAFDSDKLYCGVPKYIKPGLKFPDDYYKKAVYFQDDIYSIDIATGAAALIFSGDEILIDAYHPTIHNNQLLFINRYDDRLYGLQL